MQLAKQKKSLPLPLTALAEFVEGNRSCHVAYSGAVKNHTQSELRKAVSQFDVLDTWSSELPIKDPMFGEKRSFTRTAPGPEIGEVEHLPVLETTVGEEKSSNICDVPHQRRN